MVIQNNKDSQHILPSLSSNWLLYENSKYNIKVKYPTTWNYQNKDNPWSSFVIFFPRNDKQSGANISISIEFLSDLISLQEFIKKFKQEVLEYNEKCNFLEKKESTFLHTAGLRVTFECIRENQKIKKMAVITLRDKRAYTIYYEVEVNSFSQFESIANMMLNSLDVSSH
ncbi:PsbP-related protein [Scytonema sp. NUACC26]|uniref:PsbP-related protein n=1 Tax=Scytonema sp. NUACC26 TaxID=3140176 RepID=UPI0034DC2B40